MTFAEIILEYNLAVVAKHPGHPDQKVHGHRHKVSATGANKFSRGFSRHNLDAHWGGPHDHSNEFPGMTKEQYAKRALALIQMPVGGNILGYANTKNQVVRYHKATNEFVKGDPNRGIATFFKPKYDSTKPDKGAADGYRYYLSREKEETGS